MGGLSAKSKKKKRSNAIKRMILKPVFDQQVLAVAENCELASRGLNTMKTKPKNAFLHPTDPAAVFPQNDPEAIFDTRVQKHPEAVFAWEARKKSNRLKSQSNQEFVRTVEEENEIEMLEAMKKMNVDDDRAEEEDMNELIDAMGRLQIHEKVKASRYKKGKRGGMQTESGAGSTWKPVSPKYDKKKLKAAKHKSRF